MNEHGTGHSPVDAPRQGVAVMTTTVGTFPHLHYQGVIAPPRAGWSYVDLVRRAAPQRVAPPRGGAAGPAEWQSLLLDRRELTTAGIAPQSAAAPLRPLPRAGVLVDQRGGDHPVPVGRGDPSAGAGAARALPVPAAERVARDRPGGGCVGRCAGAERSSCHKETSPVPVIPIPRRQHRKD